jgi:hypothetical protein
MIESQFKKIDALIEGENVQYISEIFLLIFGDFKKHTFKYQFLSPAQAV